MSKIIATSCNEYDLTGIYIAGMFKRLTYTLCLIIATLAFPSCAMDGVSLLTGEGSVMISGLITDKTTGTPLKDIKVTYQSYSLKGKLIDTQIVYSSSDGTYTVEAEGYTSEINCTMTASDNEGNYIESKIELNIDWNSSVFNAETGIFFVNDCNFHLQKATKK